MRTTDPAATTSGARPNRRPTSPASRVGQVALAVVAAAVVLSVGHSDASGAPPGVTASVKKSRLTVTGTSAADQVTVRLRPGDPSVVEVDAGGDGAAEFAFARTRFSAIDVTLGGGPDVVRIDDSAGLFTDTEATTLDGGDGADTVLGGRGPEVLVGGAGADFVDGNMGLDRATLGRGDDVFQWDPGDGSDVLDGQDGTDRLLFNGSSIGESLDLQSQPQGGRLRLQRDIGAVTLDTDGIERIELPTRGGTDTITVHDLAGTAVTDVAVDLAGPLDPNQGDTQADQVIVEGTSGTDAMTLGQQNGVPRVISGSGTVVSVAHAEPANDTLGVNPLAGGDTVTADPAVGAAIRAIIDGGEGTDTVTTNGTANADTFAAIANGSTVAVSAGPGPFYELIAESLVINGTDGDDMISAAGSLAALTALTFDGGDGEDTILGGNGADTLIGGPGADFVDGNQGADTAQLGTGEDTFQWDPGDSNDVIDGQEGTDRLLFNGSTIGETLDLQSQPQGGRLRLQRDIGTVTLDAGGIEQAELRTRGGSDTVVVHDLTGTGLAGATVDLAGPTDPNQGDAAIDHLGIAGTNGIDAMSVGTSEGVARVTGPGTTVVSVTHADPASDTLALNTLGDNDQITADPAVGALIKTSVDGSDGIDTVTTNGTAGSDTFAAIANGSTVAVSAGPGPFYELIAESLVINGMAGNDTISAAGNLAALTALTFDGGDGEDTILGGNGADTLRGGNGADLVDGNQGLDTAQLGTGEDVFQWDAGDGSDVIDGQAGVDRLLFNGNGASESLDLSATGSHLHVRRDVASIDLDTAGLERVDLPTRGSADLVTVHDLAGTGVSEVAVDLAGPADPTQGDTQADAVVVEGTSGADIMTLGQQNGVPRVISGSGTVVSVAHAEPANDTLAVNALGDTDTVTADPAVGAAIRAIIDGGEGADTVTTNGTANADTFAAFANGSTVAVSAGPGPFYELIAESLVLNGTDGDDMISAAGSLAALTALTFDGGDGEDTILGGNGADTLIGGPGADFVDGNQGADTAQLGTGEDTFQWDPGDSNDVIDGQEGTDRLLFNGSTIGETLDLQSQPQGGRLRLQRDIGTVTLDAGGIEEVELRTRAGADRVTVHDLTGSAVTDVAVDLAGPVDPNQGDGQPDQVIVEGTNAVDTISVSATGGITRVAGLAATVEILHPELAGDRLDINTLAGDDVVDSQLPPGVIQLFVDGSPA